MKQFKFDGKTDKLFETILRLKTKGEAERFFRDLCTVQELKEMSERWAIVRLLVKNANYREIANEIEVSTTTVTRVANWLNNGTGGYWLAINRDPSLAPKTKKHHLKVSLVGNGITLP